MHTHLSSGKHHTSLGLFRGEFVGDIFNVCHFMIEQFDDESVIARFDVIHNALPGRIFGVARSSNHRSLIRCPNSNHPPQHRALGLGLVVHFISSGDTSDDIFRLVTAFHGLAVGP